MLTWEKCFSCLKHVANDQYTLQHSFPLDLIKVTEGKPLFSAEESATVIQQAETEGVDKNEYESGKYRLGGEKMSGHTICILI